MIKKIALVLLIFNLFLYGFLKIKMHENIATSFLFCSSMLWINLIGLAVISKIVISFHKTSLAVLITLLKYPLIGISIFWASKQTWINSIGIVIGICAFLIIIVLTVLLDRNGESPK